MRFEDALVEAEHQLNFGTSLTELHKARDALRAVAPANVFVRMLDTKIARMTAVEIERHAEPRWPRI